jgi:hypothetical protein
MRVMDIGRFSDFPRDNRPAESPAESKRKNTDWQISYPAVPEVVREAVERERLETEQAKLRVQEEAKLRAQLEEADQECRTNVRSELGELADIPDGLTHKEFEKRMNSRILHIQKAERHLNDYAAATGAIDPARAESLRRELKPEIDRRAAGTAEIILNQKLEDGHQLRIADSRPPGFAERSADQICSNITEHVVREFAALAVNHIAPGAGHAVVEVIFAAKKALSTINQLEHGNALVISMPIALGNSGLSIDLSTKLTDEIPDNDAPRISAAMDFSLDGPPQTGDPDIELIDLADPVGPPSDAPGNAEGEQAAETAEPEQFEHGREGKQEQDREDFGLKVDKQKDSEAADPADGLAGFKKDGELKEDSEPKDDSELKEDSETAGEVAAGPPTDRSHDIHRPAPPRTGPVDSPAPRSAGLFPPSIRSARSPARPAGVVVCKSAASAAAAAGTAVVDPAALLAMARREICARFYRRTPGSVVALMQALGALEVVVLVVPDLGCGMWVDVDPLTQSPAASMFFTMAPAKDGLRFMFFTQRKQPPSP